MQGNLYEYFIRRAFNCQRDEHGATTAIFKYVLDSDFGNGDSKQYNKYLTEVKKHLGKAVDKFLSFKLSEEEKTTLIVVNQEIELAESGISLIEPIRKGLDITKRFK